MKKHVVTVLSLGAAAALALSLRPWGVAEAPVQSPATRTARFLPHAPESPPAAPQATSTATVTPTLAAPVEPPTPTPLAVVAGDPGAGGIKAVTCDDLRAVAEGNGEFATRMYVGMAITAVKGGPVPGSTVTLTEGQREAVRRALGGLRGEDGLFCGLVPDPGGW